ncbi:hypothetical protein Tco_1451944 [Tanacetum coccineum]
MALPPRDQRHEWLRGQSPEKVTTTNLFFLYSMEDETVLGVHFGVITEQSLLTLTVEVRDLQTNDLEELIRLRIYERLVDTSTLVVEGPQREQVGAAGIDAEIDPEIRQDAPVVPRAAVSDVRGDDERACQVLSLDGGSNDRAYGADRH